MSFNFDDIAVGVDVEEVDRFSKYVEDKSSPLLGKIFTDAELQYCFKTKFADKRLAARYCAKEAVYKALCNFGIKIVNLREIEVYHDEEGAPHVRLLNSFNSRFKIKISLSHSRKTAIAQVIAYKIKEKKKTIFRKENSDGSLRFLIL